MTAADVEPELEGEPSALASGTNNLPAVGTEKRPFSGQIIGEQSSEDYGFPPRLTLVAAISKLAEQIPAGQWALSDGIGAAVALGPRIEVVALIRTKWWLLDFGQSDGAPVRFLTEAEVRSYGGCFSKAPEPGKMTFSRSMEIRLLITSAAKVPDTFLKFQVGTREYPAALYEASRSAYRAIGVGMNRFEAANPGEKAWNMKWGFGVTTCKNRSYGSSYFAPVLEDHGPTSAAERMELARIVERQLPN